MKYYVEAYRSQTEQILGNLDGQTVLHCKYPKRTNHYKMLMGERLRPRWQTVYKWVIVDEQGKVFCEIHNKYFKYRTTINT